MDGLEWIDDGCIVFHFSLVDLHVSFGRHEGPRTGNITRCHVGIRYVIIYDAVNLKWTKRPSLNHRGMTTTSSHYVQFRMTS